MTPRLAIRAVGKKFGGAVAVSNINVTLANGSIMGLIGPNGSGKTTLINLINGLIRPDSGEVYLNGASITHALPSQRADLGVTRTFQTPRVFRSLTVRQNLYVPLLHTSASTRTAAATRIDELLTLTGLQDDSNCLAGILSGGQQKLLEFARALVSKPGLILMDEPFAGVHPSVIDVMCRGIRMSAKTSECAFLIASHEVPELLNIVDTMMAMVAGHSIAVGLPQDVVRNNTVLESYLGLN